MLPRLWEACYVLPWGCEFIRKSSANRYDIHSDEETLKGLTFWLIIGSFVH